MIKISIKKENNDIKEISIKGHALYDDFGKDIVCAAASSIVITTVNAICLFDKENIKYTEQPFNITVLKNTKECNVLLENMINMLKELEHDYPKNIKIL